MIEVATLFGLNTFQCGLAALLLIVCVVAGIMAVMFLVEALEGEDNDD